MKQEPHQVEDIAKTILRGLLKHGRNVSFAEILREAGYIFDSSKQIELATTLEALGLIQSVVYRLPMEIRAELTPSGETIAKSAESKTPRKKKNQKPDHPINPNTTRQYPSA